MIFGQVDLPQNCLNLTQKHVAGCAESDAPFAAFEQPCTELALERHNLQAQGRLRDIQHFGSSPKMEFLGERGEVTQLPEFHLFR